MILEIMFDDDKNQQTREFFHTFCNLSYSVVISLNAASYSSFALSSSSSTYSLIYDENKLNLSIVHNKQKYERETNLNIILVYLRKMLICMYVLREFSMKKKIYILISRTTWNMFHVDKQIKRFSYMQNSYSSFVNKIPTIISPTKLWKFIFRAHKYAYEFCSTFRVSSFQLSLCNY